MREQELNLDTGEGAIPVFVTRPEEGGPHPVVILYMDALGIREELRDMARRIGTVGYYVMLPNLFWRHGGPSFDPAPLAEGRLDPEMVRLNQETTHARVLADTGRLLDHAAGDQAAGDVVGTIGYCMGGRHALAAAGTYPDRVAAMVSLHAGFQVTERPDSAHLLIPSVRAGCYFGFADNDPLSPPEHQDVLAAACRAHGVEARFEVYPGALHGFTFPTRYCFHKPSAERAWERVFGLFRRRLG